jgi:hypothetical protein
LLDYIKRHFTVVLALGSLTGRRPEYFRGFADLLIASDDHLNLYNRAAKGSVTCKLASSEPNALSFNAASFASIAC